MRRNLHCKVSKGNKHKRYWLIQLFRGLPLTKYVRSCYVKSLEERLRKTESLLRAAGIAVEEDHDAEDGSSVDDDDSLSSNHHDSGRDAESRSMTGRATGEKGLFKSGNPEQSFNSNALAKFYRRRRPTAKNTPPVYRAEKGYSMYHGTPMALLVALRFGANLSQGDARLCRY